MTDVNNWTEASSKARRLDQDFIYNLCIPNCPLGLNNINKQCFKFIRSRPWLENIAKENWEVSKPVCLLDESG